MDWQDKLYAVYDSNRLGSGLVYWLSVPYILFLDKLGCFGKEEEDPFGYLWLAKDKRKFIQSCRSFNKDNGLCSIHHKFCPVPFSELCLEVKKNEF